MTEHSPGPISVIVPVLDEADSIGPLLDALVSQLRPDDEIVVVDGGSTDATISIAGSKGDAVRVLSAPDTNISQARNAGVRAARNDVIACTDAGCTPAPGWLSAIRTCFQADPRPDLVTGIYEVTARNALESAMGVACYPDPSDLGRSSMWTTWYGRLFGRTFDPRMPTGRSMAFAKEAWDAVGGFREDLETSEDVSFGRALAQLGRTTTLCPDARVTWDQRPSLASTALMYFRYGRGGSRSGDPKVISRDMIRAAVYGAAGWVAVSGGPAARLGMTAAGLVYLSLPVARAVGRPQGAKVAALVPVALATKDLAKAAGLLIGLATSLRARSHSPEGDVVDQEGATAVDRSFDPEH
ncbi:MAG: hypothetical protein QOF16_1050 [Actinomycetota bacterium]|nr:hypothetical protein [Actinomycetota bacterium]